MVNSKGKKMVVFSMFVMGIIAIALLSTIGDQVSTITNTKTYNTSSGDAALDVTPLGSIVKLEGKFVTNFLAINQTNITEIIQSGNYTLANNQNVDGVLSATINASGAIGDFYAGSGVWNVSYTYQPLGYLSGSADRSIVSLLLIMAALGMLLVLVAKLFSSEGMRELLRM